MVASALEILLLLASYVLAAATLSFCGRRLRVFADIRGVRWASICFVLAPIAIGWAYGWALRIFPGKSPDVYLYGILSALLAGALLEVWRLGATRSVSQRGRTMLTTMPQLITAGVFTAFAIAVLFLILLNNLRTPISANDPLEYFTVARAIFERQQLLGVYPLLDPNLTMGFYGPWTHPPGFVLMLSWAFVVQGTAEYAGVAKVLNIYGMSSLLFLVFAWSGGMLRLRGILAALAVLLTPLLLSETFDTHVDVIRVALWTAAFCCLPTWFNNLSIRNSIGLGVIAGLSMFIHSIGILFWFLMAGLVILVSAGTLQRRVTLMLLAAATSALMVAPDYYQNVVLFGRLIGDSAPLWDAKGNALNHFLNEDRQIATIRDKFVNGLFAFFARTDVLGLAPAAMALAAILYLSIALQASRFRPLKTFQKLTRPKLLNILLLASIGFLGAIFLSILLGMNLIIKNIRYIATMSGIVPILTLLAADRVIRYAAHPAKSRVAAFLWVIQAAVARALVQVWGEIWNARYRAAVAILALVLALSVAINVARDYRNRSLYFPGAALRPDLNEMDDTLSCARGGGFALVAQINRAVVEHGRLDEVLVLAFRPADSAYYARFRFVSYLDPRLLPAYLAADSTEAYQRLRDLGVSHIMVPPYRMGEIERTAFEKLLKEKSLIVAEAEIAGFTLYRLADAKPLFPKPTDTAAIAPGQSVEIDLSTVSNLEDDRGNRLDRACGEGVEVIKEDGEAVVRVIGSRLVLTHTKYAVDPTRPYRVSFDIRSSGQGPHSSLFARAGLAIYDASRRLETTPSGAHRYGVFNDWLPTGDNWTTVWGDFNGNSDTNFNSFGPDTRYVAPVINLISSDTSEITEIRRLRIEALQ